MPAPCGNCGNAILGTEWSNGGGQCRFCWLALHHPRFRELYYGTEGPFTPHDCIHRGPELGQVGCETCGGNVRVKKFACSVRGECTIDKDVGVARCTACPERRPLELQQAYDWHDLGKTVPGQRRFNSSLLRQAGRLVMATRLHTSTGWSAGQIMISVLADDFGSASQCEILDLAHSLTALGAEDPRLFVHRGELHVAFTGVQRAGPEGMITHQLYARLDDRLRVREIFCPDYRHRQPWEKNWGFFSRGDQLYAVYNIAAGGNTHQILKIDGNKATLAHESQTTWPSVIGQPRGGAAPFKRGNEWYSFFHDVRDGERREYNLCLYTFEDQPPFQINRFVRTPLFSPTKSHRPNTWTPDVVFPGGAFLENNLWHVASGYYDQWSWLLRFDVNQVEKLLEIAPGGRDEVFDYQAAFVEMGQGQPVWSSVCNRNEYRLPDSLAGQTVVDLGGHIGSFARACLDRGAEHVLSVEPLPANCQAFRHNLAVEPGDLCAGVFPGRCGELPTFPEDDRFYNDGDGGRTIYYPWLQWLVKQYQPPVIGEIGVFRGLSALAMSAHHRSYVGFDNEGLVPLPLVEGYARAEVHSLDTQAQASLRMFFPVPANLFHVDGDHSFAGCLHDLHLAGEVLAPDGVIVCDDAFPGSEPFLACREFAGTMGYTLRLMSKQRTMTGKAVLTRGQKWTLIEAAAFGGTPPPTATMGGYSLLPQGNWSRATVPTVQLGSLSCDLLKLDVEGAEYEILENTDLSGVKSIVGEGHLYAGFPDMPWLTALLESRGFKVRTQVTGEKTYLFWANRN